MAEDFNEEKEEIEISDAEKISVLLNKVKSLEKINKNLNDELRRKYSIFYPKSSRMLTADYPEFKKVREFKDINRGDLLFVWYFACEGSPLIDIHDEKERLL